MFANAFSFRLILLGAVAGVVVGAPIGGLVWAPLFWIVGIPVFLVVWLGLANGPIATSCPYCRKRVKLGATVCHHCGREAVPHTPK